MLKLNHGDSPLSPRLEIMSPKRWATARQLRAKGRIKPVQSRRWWCGALNPSTASAAPAHRPIPAGRGGRSRDPAGAGWPRNDPPLSGACPGRPLSPPARPAAAPWGPRRGRAPPVTAEPHLRAAARPPGSRRPRRSCFCFRFRCEAAAHGAQQWRRGRAALSPSRPQPEPRPRRADSGGFSRTLLCSLGLRR